MPIPPASARPQLGLGRPANRRVLYNRASCDTAGKPFNPARKLIGWNGKSWGGADVPDFKIDEDRAKAWGPSSCCPKAWRASSPAPIWPRAPSRALRALRDPARLQPDERQAPRGRQQSGARVFPGDWANFGKADAFPHVATTYRLTEHFHYWTKHARINAVLQPEQFVEIGEALAKEIGIVAGDRVKVSSKRGYIKAVALVTKRIKPLQIDGRTVHTVGVPIHWGFTGLAGPASRQHADALRRRRQLAERRNSSPSR